MESAPACIPPGLPRNGRIYPTIPLGEIGHEAHTRFPFPMRFASPHLRSILVLPLLLVLASGCVNRRMTIRSDPPGALVEVDGQRIGLTPVSMDFTYYGTREITLSMPGYETLTVQQPVPIPLYQRFPFDFISNHFLPGRITDRHDFTYQLTRRQLPIDEETNLINRGRNFRSQAQIGTVP